MSNLENSLSRLAGLRKRYAEGGFVTSTQIVGTNCANCLYANQPVEKAKPEELNPQGGLLIKGKQKLERARKADLITMPGSGKPTAKFGCNHPKVKQSVNERMCCIYWDAPGTYRPWQVDPAK